MPPQPSQGTYNPNTTYGNQYNFRYDPSNPSGGGTREDNTNAPNYNLGNQSQQQNGSPALIVTSGQSRGQYSTNVNKMNETTATMQRANEITLDQATKSKEMALAYQKQELAKRNAKPTIEGTAPKAPDVAEPKVDEIGTERDFLKEKFEKAMVDLDKGIENAKTNMEQARATLAYDPAAEAAVSQIMQKYDQQIQIMKEKNEMVMGANKRNNSRYGMQYTSEMNENFMSDQQDRAQRRVMDLVTQATIAATKVRAAYKEGNLKAFNDAQKAYETASKDKLDAINDLLKETDKQVKEQQASVKLEQTLRKAALDEDIKLSANLGKIIADELSTSKITDPKKQKEYIAKMAETYGIENPDILANSVVKAEQEAKRQDLLNKNTQSVMNKRAAPKVTTKKTTTVKPQAVTFDAKTKDALVGAGNTTNAVTQLSQDIAKYGIDDVLARGKMDDATREVLKAKYNK